MLASWNYPAAICASPACGLQVYYGLMLFALCTSCLEQVNTKTVTVMPFFHGRHFAVGPLGCCNWKQKVNRHGEDYSRKVAEYHHLLDFPTNEQCLIRRIQQQDMVAHSSGIWLPGHLLFQIEDISATLNSPSKGTLCYGANRRKGEKNTV